jgi:simple sugar transport system permease protein
MNERNPRTADRWLTILLPVVNLGVALAITALVIRVLGESPWQAFKLMINGSLATADGLGYTLYYATNFAFTGLAVAVAYHAGVFNIGAEGQAYIGGLGSGLVALWLGQRSPWVVLPLAITAGALFGAAWAFIPAWLQARRGSHIVITTIMFNFIASALMTYLLVNVLINPGQQSPETREFAANAAMPPIGGSRFASTPLNASLLLALLAAGLVWFWLWRTRWGYGWCVVGQNPEAAVYAGLKPGSIVIVSMLVSGALAGCLGLNELLGSQHRIVLEFPAGAGFVGIAVALMGRNHPVGILLAAMLFGALNQAGSQLSFDMPKINRDLVVVIQGLVILLCGAMENLLLRPLAWTRRWFLRAPR